MSTAINLPATVRTSVSVAALTKVGRLFNGTARDVLTELLQNARRAAATLVRIELLAEAEGARLVVCDDGIGIADPSLLFALGASGWDDPILAREDPAGMGVFSLAGCAVTIRSRARGASTGWRVAIAPRDWEAGTSLAVEADPIVDGTEFSIACLPAWTADLAQVAAEVARFHPLPVTFCGHALAQSAWLADAVAIEEVAGCRIGICRDGSASDQSPRVNFHGVAVPCRLPMLTEVGADRSWTVRVDIVDAPALQLVLPARKEMVENAALQTLRAACEAALFRAVAAHGEHRLAFTDWRRGVELGVALPEAARHLSPWTGDLADASGCWPTVAPLDDERIILVDSFDPDLAQSAARALGDGRPLGGRLADTVSQFQGYSWYDALPRIVGFDFAIEAAGRVRHHSGDGTGSGSVGADLDFVSGHVDGLTLGITFASGDHRTVTADLLVINPDWSWLDDVIVLVARDAPVKVDALVDLLDAACFAASDEGDSDSWDTQHAQFRRDARQRAIELLLSGDTAILDRVAHEAEANIRWLVPKDRRVVIEIADTQVAVRFDDAATAA